MPNTNDKPCIKCGSTDRYKPKKGKKTGDCKACMAKYQAARRARPEGKAKQAALHAAWYDKNKDAKAAYHALPEVKAKQAAIHDRAKSERNAHRNLLLMSMGVTDLTQTYDFHHVTGRKTTGHQTVARLLLHKPTWEQAWEEAHELTVVMARADHKEYHRTHKMQEDGTFAVRP